MAGGFNASMFGQPLGMLRNLGTMGTQIGGQGFQPDLAGPMAISKAFGALPAMGMGGGRTFSPAAMTTGADVLNQTTSQALPQQGGEWAQQQFNLSDFLLGTASDRDQIMAMLASLRAQKQKADTAGVAGTLGAFGL